MRKSAALILLFLSLFSPLANAQDTFQLNGKLIQGTPDGQPLTSSLPLRLKLLSADGEVLQTLSAASDSDGNFTFEAVPIDTEAFYVVTTFWAGIEQSSLPVKYEELGETLEFPLYELTESLADVVANRGNLRIEFTEVNAVGVQMLLELNYANLGQRIVLSNPNSPDAASFTIELPVGAFGIAPEQAPGSVQRFVPVEQVPIPGVRDTQPLVPNWPNVMRVSFFVPYQDGAVIDMRFPFAVADMGVFVREDTVQLESSLLALSEEKQTSSGRTYAVYTQIEPLDAGEPFKFTLLGQPTITTRPTAAPNEPSSSSIVLIVLVLGALIVFGGLMAWFIRSRQVESQQT